MLPPIPARIEDYALLADCNSAALVSRAGSVDWLCWPRFDSGACLAALLGTEEHGRWQICPTDAVTGITRHYRDGSKVLETVFETASGAVAVIDFMPMEADATSLIRIVEGRRGTVPMQMRLRLRLDYGRVVPWVNQLDEADSFGITAVAGPDVVVLRGDVQMEGRDMETVSAFDVADGKHVRFVMSHGASHLDLPSPLDAYAELDRTEAIWRAWSDRCEAGVPFAEEIKRSLLTLKALTYTTTGGIVAAPTTSLPEALGGGRNWDYRFCWLRDATMTLFALMNGGFFDEADAWTKWLHRSIAGGAEQVQIMYGLSGERRLPEIVLDWLPGYEASAPVRIGNEAAAQIQLDVFGEIMGALRQARLGGLTLPDTSWALQCTLLDHLSTLWRGPDAGMWEIRGERRHYTFSKVAAWSAFHSAIRDAEQFGFEGKLDEWRATRDAIHDLVCENGFDTARNSFVQSFGSTRVDASLLLIALVGFIAPDDPRMIGTVAAIEADLIQDGLVLRYATDGDDNLQGEEGAFIACSFWLVSALALQGRTEDAHALFHRLLGLANDVGLMAEEYDLTKQRLVGNFPQAFSHLALVTSAAILRGGWQPLCERAP